MRAREFIIEASIFNGSYTYGHKVRISSSAAGKKLLSALENEITFDPKGNLEWINPSPEDSKNSPVIEFGKSNDPVKYFKTDEGDIFGIDGNENAIQKALVHAKRYNRGDIAEALLGAAVTAKLIRRGGDRIGTITTDDIKKVLRSAIKDSDNQISLTVTDKSSEIADKIVYTLKLPSGSMYMIQNVDNWELFTDLFDSAVHYANSRDCERYSNYFYINGKKDEVRIVSDGVSDQKGRKTDVQAVVTTTDPKTGKVRARNLKNVDISLKADSATYGQIGAGGLTHDEEAWFFAAKSTFESFGIILHKPEGKHEDIKSFWGKIYDQVAQKLTKALSQASVNKETTFIEKIADAINKQGSLGNQFLKLVNFEKGKSSIHSFSHIKRKLIDQNIDLAVDYRSSKNGIPSIVIYDKHEPKKAKGILTRIRFYIGKEKAATYFEKGNLLHDLSRIDKSEPLPQPNFVSPEPIQNPTPQKTEPLPPPQRKEKPTPVPKKTEPIPTAKPAAPAPAAPAPEEPSPYSNQLSQFARPQTTLSPRTDSTWRQKFKRR